MSNQGYGPGGYNQKPGGYNSGNGGYGSNRGRGPGYTQVGGPAQGPAGGYNNQRPSGGYGPGNGGYGPGNGGYGSGNNQRPQGGAGLSIASMVLGIVSLLVSCCIPYIPILTSIIGIVLGAVAISKKNKGRNMAIAGLVCSVISIVLGLLPILIGGSILSSLGLMGGAMSF